MPYRGLVNRAYLEAVNSMSDIDADLKRALRAHERVPDFITRLAFEFEKIAALRLRSGKPLPADKHLKAVVKDFAEVFVKGIQEDAKRRHESQVQKTIREAIRSDAEALDKTASGIPTGDYADLIEEAGITSIDSRDVYGEEKKGQGRSSTTGPH